MQNSDSSSGDSSAFQVVSRWEQIILQFIN